MWSKSDRERQLFILFYFFYNFTSSPRILLFIYLFLYLFLAVLGPRLCERAFSSCGEGGPLFIVVRGPLTIAAFLVAEHRLQTRRLSSCGSRAQLLRGMWDLPRPWLKPVSPALAGRFSTTAPPGKPERQLLYDLTYMWNLKKKVKLIETESRMVVSGGVGGYGQMLIREYNLHV